MISAAAFLQLIWPSVVKVTLREPVSPVNRGLDTPELPISKL
jgi:hypothetical protein